MSWSSRDCLFLFQGTAVASSAGTIKEEDEDESGWGTSGAVDDDDANSQEESKVRLPYKPTLFSCPLLRFLVSSAR